MRTSKQVIAAKIGIHTRQDLISGEPETAFWNKNKR